MREVRWKKSAAEMACLHEAARIAVAGLERAREVIRPGVSELEVQGEVVRALTAAGGEMPAMMIPVLSGAKTIPYPRVTGGTAPAAAGLRARVRSRGFQAPSAPVGLAAAPHPGRFGALESALEANHETVPPDRRRYFDFTIHDAPVA